MNNILFCKSLVTEGNLMTDYAYGAMGFYDLETLALVDNVAEKDFGIIGSSIVPNEKGSIINIPDIHLLNSNVATLPLNLSYSIIIKAVETEVPDNNEEEEEVLEEHDSTEVVTPTTNDVELVIIHNNVVPNGNWRQYITIPYADFNGDTDTLLSIIEDKLTHLSEVGRLDGIIVNQVDNGSITLYSSNTEQYIITTKSELLSITNRSSYKPVTLPYKLIELIDKNTNSWGIQHREEEDKWFEKVANVINDADVGLTTVISLRYVTTRKASVTHDEPIYNTLHIITTEELSADIMEMFEKEEESLLPGGDDQVTPIGDNTSPLNPGSGLGNLTP